MLNVYNIRVLFDAKNDSRTQLLVQLYFANFLASMNGADNDEIKPIMENLMVVHLKPLYSGPVTVYFGPVTKNGTKFKVCLQLEKAIKFKEWKKSVDSADNAVYTIKADMDYFGRDDIPKGQVHFFIKLL